MLPKILYTKREAASILSISTGMLDNLIAHRQLLVRRLGRRVLVPVSELERFGVVEDQVQPAAMADTDEVQA